MSLYPSQLFGKSAQSLIVGGFHRLGGCGAVPGKDRELALLGGSGRRPF
jgi:hypothetical protein